MTSPNLPIVKQCADPTNDQFGSVAVAATNVAGMQWMVATPTNGGHYATDEQVADWPVLDSPPVEVVPQEQITPPRSE